MARSSSSPSAGGRSRRPLARKALFAGVTLALSCLIAGLLFETVFRVLEALENRHQIKQGDGGSWEADPRWGWRPAPGWFRRATSEFDVSGEINALYMNDAPVDLEGDRRLTRVLALGDSHTFAVGAAMDETWVNVLERRLNDRTGADRFRVYNGAMVGYNLHQYLLRLIDQGPLLRPHYVVVGLSYATDFYDLLPADRGGWIYGPQFERDYFDLDDGGQLVELHWQPSDAEIGRPANPARTLRRVAGNFATFRFLRRSPLAIAIGSRLRIGGQSMWPNMEVVVTRDIGSRHAYPWRLALALLERIDRESRALGAELIVLGIPYLPQVYDEVWEETFGSDERYSRTAASDRVRRWCDEHGVIYVETVDAMRERSQQLGRWLHWPKDAHPTAEGHELIADVLLGTGAIRDNATMPPAGPPGNP